MVGFFVLWIEENWFDFLQSGGIVAGLFFTGFAALQGNRSRNIETLLSITESHRTLWLQIFSDPHLLRILKPKAALKSKPVTAEERIFVNLIILHLTGVLAAMRAGVMEKPAGLDADLAEFFSLPIPAEVWKATLHYRDAATRKYVEDITRKKTRTPFSRRMAVLGRIDLQKLLPSPFRQS